MKRSFLLLVAAIVLVFSLASASYAAIGGETAGTAMNAANATIQIKNSSGSVVKKWTKAKLSKSGSTYRDEEC